VKRAARAERSPRARGDCERWTRARAREGVERALGTDGNVRWVGRARREGRRTARGRREGARGKGWRPRVSSRRARWRRRAV
jgi:hypothetical protein